MPSLNQRASVTFPDATTRVAVWTDGAGRKKEIAPVAVHPKAQRFVRRVQDRWAEHPGGCERGPPVGDQGRPTSSPSSISAEMSV